MTYPHGGGREIWRDGVGATYNPDKAEIRDWADEIELRQASLFKVSIQSDHTAELQSAFTADNRVRAISEIAHVSSTLLTNVNQAHFFDFSEMTIRQADGANLTEIVRNRGVGNSAGCFKARIDGNRDNNTAPVVGVDFDGTMAGDRVVIDVSGTNCETLARMSGEAEHCEIKVFGKDCGTVFEVDTSTGTADENDIKVFGYRSDTLFRAQGDPKSSGLVQVFGEVINDWAIDLANGWYSLSGIVRGCGSISGGGCRITSTTGGRIYFGGLKLFGQNPAPNNGTWGLFVDAPETWLDGTVILGVFDGGAWFKRCKTGSSVRINMTAASQHTDAMRFGDAASGAVIDACEFNLNVAGATAGTYGVHLDNAKNSVFNLLGEVSSGGTEIHISAESFDNRLVIGRRLATATNRNITNARVQEDNVVLFLGSYTRGDLAQINDGSYFSGMRVEELREDGARRGPAYYDKDLDDWVLGDIPDEQSAANIAAAAHSVNTSAKHRGKRIWDLTNRRELRARGPLPTDAWDVIDGSASVTPV